MSKTTRIKMHKTKKKLAKRLAQILTASMAILPMMVTAPSLIEATVVDIPSTGHKITDKIATALDSKNIGAGNKITIDLDDIIDTNPAIIIQNKNVANVELVSGDLLISAKQQGTTTVDIFATYLSNSVHERFRLTVGPNTSIDTEPGFDIGDIVKYISLNPGKGTEAYENLLYSIDKRTAFANKAPTSDGEVFNVNIGSDQIITYDLNDFFNDEDGDALQFSPISSMNTYASASLTNNILTLQGITHSSDMVLNVTASVSNLQNSPTKTFHIMPNRPVELNAANQVGVDNKRTLIFRQGQSATVDLSEIFTDPDGDSKFYKLTAYPSGNTAVSLSGSVASFSDSLTGMYDTKFEGSDKFSSDYIWQMIQVNVTNSPSIPNFTGVTGSFDINLNDYFTTGSLTSFSVAPFNSGNLTIDQSLNSTLHIVPTSSGTTTNISVTAADGHGGKISDNFTVAIGTLSSSALVPISPPTSPPVSLP